MTSSVYALWKSRKLLSRNWPPVRTNKSGSEGTEHSGWRSSAANVSSSTSVARISPASTRSAKRRAAAQSLAARRSSMQRREAAAALVAHDLLL
eukprot:CAMPEP_0119362402 /NCGR_PEP_ID=MMETSP1334-20130426/9481_1 /TAXON_ID=127549 /ORGANISM="Calcidiscus leptoporus, Strain RCC1130" /LENGTH=93 /DNA_ID=CAMNT_0007377615 /DNA_START=206 /DNA_END=488 /DNA_ORIENTATION=+